MIENSTGTKVEPEGADLGVYKRLQSTGHLLHMYGDNSRWTRDSFVFKAALGPRRKN